MTRQQPSRDLPVIHEVSTPQEIDDVDDTASKESYAFTLDGVGFDEESGSILHTPPGLVSPERLVHHEVDLHRQTCRTLGIPYREMTESPRESDSSSGGISLERREDHWPWDQKQDGDLYDVPLEGTKTTLPACRNNDDSNRKPSTMSVFKLSTSRLITLAKLVEIASSYSRAIKCAAISISNKSKKLFVDSNPKYIIHSTDNSDKKTSVDTKEWQPNWYNDANPLLKLTMGAALFFVLCCTLVIVVVMGVSKSAESGAFEKDASSLINVGTLSSVFKNETSIDSENDSAGGQLSTSLVPSYLPTISPTGINATPDSCFDRPGEFKTSRGKSRECSWLTKRLNQECGWNGREPSELGSRCGYACRDHNGCGESARVAEQTKFPSNEPATSQPTMLTVRPARNQNNKKHNKQSTVVIEGSVKSSSPTSEQTSISAGQENKTLTQIQSNFFIDDKGVERPCTWLDIRNWHQMAKRRDANCDNVVVQTKCPSSCVDYSTPMNEMKNTMASAPQFLQSQDLVSRDECNDQTGYFLNEKSDPVKCLWLTEDGLDLVDVQVRREKNCGGSTQYPVVTDLGKMCRYSCGRC